MPSCSILIPTQGQRKSLSDSVESARAQTVQPNNIIVDFTAGYEKLNNMVSKVSNEDAFVLLGDDDLLDPKFLEKTLAKMEAENADIVYTGMQRFGAISDYIPPRPWTQEFIEHDTVPWFTSLCKVKVWEALGGFDLNVGKCLDWDFWWRAYKAGFKAVWVNEPLFFYRIHPGQDSVNGMEEARQRVINKNL